MKGAITSQEENHIQEYPNRETYQEKNPAAKGLSFPGKGCTRDPEETRVRGVGSVLHKKKKRTKGKVQARLILRKGDCSPKKDSW